MKNKKRLNKQILEDFYEKKYYSMEMIAKKLRVSRSTVGNRLKFYNIKIRTRSVATKIRWIRSGVIILDKKILEDLYFKKYYSTEMMAKELKVSYSIVEKWLKFYNFKIRTISESCKMRQIRHFIILSDRKTLENFYIKKRYSKGRIAKELRVSVSTIRRLLEFYNFKIRTISESKKGQKHSEITKRLIKEKRKHQITPVKDTLIEVKLQNFLKQLNIEFYTHQYVNIKHGYQCDIFIPSLNLVIECDGEYWHKYPTGKEIDHVRTKELIEKGFKVLRLWGFEINEMSIEKFKERLQKYGC